MDLVVLATVTLASIGLALVIGWGLLNGVLNRMARRPPQKGQHQLGL